LLGELGVVSLVLDEHTAQTLAERAEIVEVIEDSTFRRLGAKPQTCSTGVTSPSARSHVSAETVGGTAAPDRKPAESVQSPWNIELMRARFASEDATGAGVRVALLDTGIAADHPDIPIAGGVSFVPGVASWIDDNGHGTHCAGIIGARNCTSGSTGVAPGCDLYAVKVLSSDGRGTLTSILAGLLWCAEHAMQVVAISVGTPARHENERAFLVYERAVARCAEVGAVVIAPAGNSGHTSRPWVQHPARCTDVLAVGAANRYGEPAAFSSRGPSSLPAGCDVEVLAPGVGIRSALPDRRLFNMSGTSMACSHVAGAAALVRELRPHGTPEQIRKSIVREFDTLRHPQPSAVRTAE
ncbi:MAG TPA: S8 family peptidase, partial [Steroidobacteraceae bacterium]|nr:S8 family peptidase [Steroidobacteraceae bacterium]